MRKRIIGLIGFSVFIFVATFAFYGVKLYLFAWYSAHYKEPPVYVSTAKAIVTQWHPFLSTVGSLKSSNGVDINAEVDGQILSIDFQSGEHVKKGDLLVQLDDQVDQQNLARDQAKLQLDKIDFERKQELVKQNALSRSALDAAQAAYLQTKAAVIADTVMLSKKQIRAPFDGKIGIRLVNIGQYITTGTAIVTLQAMKPLFVDFSLPEQYLPRLFAGQTATVRIEAYPNHVFTGKITAINAKVDVNTRSIAIRATIPNEDEKLYPGLFADVQVILPETQRVITVPQTAITYSLYGDSIYQVIDQGKEKIAEQKYIKVGDRRGNVIAVTEGIQSGDEIVTAGQIKLHNQSRVIINNKVTVNY